MRKGSQPQHVLVSVLMSSPPAPEAVELQITRSGESTPRSLRWQL
jgi:hypothetical protein